MSVKKIIQFVKAKAENKKMHNFKQPPTVLPKNKIHIINLSLHLNQGRLQVSDRNFLLF